MTTTPTVFCCPLCGATSHNPNDRQQGYCGQCHAFTGDLLNPLIGEQPLILWAGPVTATLATLMPGGDARPQILATLRRVVAHLESQVDAAPVLEVDERQADADDPVATWPTDHQP